MRLVIWPYSKGTSLVRGLRERGIPHVVRRSDSLRYRPYCEDVIVNWGNSTPPSWSINRAYLINNPTAVANVVDKRQFFRCMDEQDFSDYIPPWTTDESVALEWLNQGLTVVKRTLTNGRGGAGITIVKPGDPMGGPARLYTQYIKKSHEYRVHMWGGEVLKIAQKRRMNRERRPDTFSNQVRNHSNGWIYSHDSVDTPNLDAIVTVAAAAMLSSTLNFGAVDIIYNTHYDKAYVLEVNSAPGLEGRTRDAYIEKLEELVQ